MVREGRVFSQTPGSGRPAFGMSYYVTAYEVGAEVAVASFSGTTITVRSGHGFEANDKLIVNIDSTLYRTVQSVTETTLLLDQGLSLAEGDLLVNLGLDTGSSAPNYDGSGILIYTDMDYSDLAVDSTVSSNDVGRYVYHHRGVPLWELVRTSTGSPFAIYRDVGFSASINIDVRDYGATGDGVTDDTAAIQSALDSITTSGGRVYAPSGVYMVSTALWIKSFTHFYGDGIDATIVKRIASTLTSSASAVNTNKVLMCGSVSGVPYTNLVSGSSITITDMTVDGNSANQTISAGYGADGISSGQTIGSDTGGNVDGLSIQRVKVQYVMNDGIRPHNCKNVLVDSCILYKFGQIGAVDSKNGITLTGGATEIANGWNTDAVVTNNRISYGGDSSFHTSEGVATLTWSNVVISGNNISHCDFGVEITYTSGSYTTYNISIIGNAIHDLTESTAYPMIGVACGLTSTTQHKGVTISGNSFYNINNNGIYMSYVDSAEIVGNTFRQTNVDTTQATYATCINLVDCSNFNVSSNLLKMDSAAAGVYGVVIQGFGGAVSDGLVSCNTIINAPQSGVALSGSCSKVLVSGNKILGSVTSILLSATGTNKNNAVGGNLCTGYSSSGVSDLSAQTGANANWVSDWDNSANPAVVAYKNQNLRVDAPDFYHGLGLYGTTSTSVRSPFLAFKDNQASKKAIFLSKDQSNSQDCLLLTNNAGAAAMALMDSGALRLIEQSSTPGQPTNQTMCNMYMKGDKLIIEFRDGASAGHWFSLDLTATTTQSWVYAAAAP